MTLGTMAVDHEQRIDYDKLRKDRLEKTREQMKKDGLGAVLLFDPDNVRYVTSTKLGEWVNNKLNRYTLLAEGHDPILSSAAQSGRRRCCARGSRTSVRAKTICAGA